MAAAAEPNPLMAAAFVLLLIHCAAAVGNPDIQPLLLFKSISDPKGAVLTSWNSSSDPCTSSWVGISCLRNRVTRLVLQNFGFNGSFPHSLTFLTQLRVLSLKKNGFSGPIPDLSNLTSLKLLFVSHNEFSGEFPVSVVSLTKLYRLDLSYNNFSGSIPLGLYRLTHLLTLKLEENSFTGPITGLSLPNLQDFNVSGNRLTGEIPVSLAGFSASSFLNNPVLCGPPLEKCKVVSSYPSRPDGAMASPLSPMTTVASSPTAMPLETRPPINSKNNHRNKISSLAMIAIIVGDVLVLGLVSLLLYCYFWRNYSSHKLLSVKNSGCDAEKIVYSSSSYPNPAQQGNERGKLVFFDEEMRFELEDLLRASAEMLG